MSNARNFSADLAVSNARLAKILGREPSTVTVRHSDSFGDFEYVVCPGCKGESRILNGSRVCPACSCDDITKALRSAREEIRECVEIIKATRDHNDVESEWRNERAWARLTEAIEVRRALSRAYQAGAR